MPQAKKKASVPPIRAKYHEFWIKSFIAGFVALLVLHSFQITGFFIDKLGPIILAISMSFFLTLLCLPFLNSMKRRKIPDWAGILIIYLFILGFAFLVFVAVLPIVIEQLDEFVQYINQKIKSFQTTEQTQWYTLIPFFPEGFRTIDTGHFFTLVQQNIGSLGSSITEYIGSALKGFNGLFKGVTSLVIQLILIFTFTFFIVLDRGRIYKFFHKLIPSSASKYVKKREGGFVELLHAWLKGQLILGVSIFLATYIGLWLLLPFGIDVPKKFELAFIAGCTEFIQYVGPILALIPAIIVGLGMSWKAVMGIVILYLLIQRLENNLLVPWVMSKSLDLPPFTVLAVMGVGASVFGIIGVIIAVPIASILNILIHDWLAWRKKQLKLKK